MPKSELQPVRKQDLVIGIPLAYPIYDANNHLLLRDGQVIQNEAQLEQICRQGLFQNPLWQNTRMVSNAAPSKRANVINDEAPAPKVAPKSDGRHFSQLKLQPNTPLHIHSLGDALKPKSSVKLIGWMEKMGILISALNQQGAILPFRDGETLQLKAIAGKNIVAFQATIEKVCFTPFPYLHLSWPDKLQIRQLRNSLRVSTHLIVSVSGENAEKTPAKITNLSASGAMLESSELHLLLNQNITLALRLPAAGEEHTMTLNAKVCNRHLEPPAKVVQYGLAFEPMTVSERLVLEHFIFHALLES
jgi:c-di-GMP-binding flagellar brake protein YcgR